MSYRLEHLEELEAESIFVLREAFAQFENPCILFSGGKDSIVVTHLAVKAFYPAKIPFPLVHIDTGHNFDETIEVRINNVIADCEHPDTYHQGLDDTILIKTLGIGNTTFKYRNWYYNTAPSYNVASFTLIDSSDNTYEHSPNLRSLMN